MKCSVIFLFYWFSFFFDSFYYSIDQGWIFCTKSRISSSTKIFLAEFLPWFFPFFSAKTFIFLWIRETWSSFFHILIFSRITSSTFCALKAKNIHPCNWFDPMLFFAEEYIENLSLDFVLLDRLFTELIVFGTPLRIYVFSFPLNRIIPWLQFRLASFSVLDGSTESKDSSPK